MTENLFDDTEVDPKLETSNAFMHELLNEKFDDVSIFCRNESLYSEHSEYLTSEEIDKLEKEFSMISEKTEFNMDLFDKQGIDNSESYGITDGEVCPKCHNCPCTCDKSNGAKNLNKKPKNKKGKRMLSLFDENENSFDSLFEDNMAPIDGASGSEVTAPDEVTPNATEVVPDADAKGDVSGKDTADPSTVKSDGLFNLFAEDEKKPDEEIPGEGDEPGEGKPEGEDKPAVNAKRKCCGKGKGRKLKFDLFAENGEDAAAAEDGLDGDEDPDADPDADLDGKAKKAAEEGQLFAMDIDLESASESVSADFDI